MIELKEVKEWMSKNSCPNWVLVVIVVLWILA
jgi:hypothetical protein